MAQQYENIVADARKLGKLIAETPASKAFLQTRQAVQDDETALTMLGDYQKQLEKIAELERDGKPIEPEDKHQLTSFQQKVASNENLKNWMKTQADFTELMSQVNKAIAEPFQDAPPAKA